MSSGLKAYQGNKYGMINDMLRDSNFEEKLLELNKSDKTVRYIRQIDSKLKYNNLKNEIFYRGMSGPLIPLLLKNGSNIIVNTAYTSSTLSMETTKSFTDEDGCCILIFKIPDSIKTHIYEYKGNYTESEVLIQRNTQFIIDTKKSMHPIYHAELKLYTPPTIRKSSFNLLDEMRKKVAYTDADLDYNFDSDSD